ncbi:hypothetical protein J6590_033586 [Homalodisca vitripennis]|nr:hypothetical protein J6590_033586 [Homalodisca vitripennis]
MTGQQTISTPRLKPGTPGCQILSLTQNIKRLGGTKAKVSQKLVVSSFTEQEYIKNATPISYSYHVPYSRLRLVTALTFPTRDYD